MTDIQILFTILALIVTSAGVVAAYWYARLTRELVELTKQLVHAQTPQVSISWQTEWRTETPSASSTRGNIAPKDLVRLSVPNPADYFGFLIIKLTNRGGGRVSVLSVGLRYDDPVRGPEYGNTLTSSLLEPSCPQWLEAQDSLEFRYPLSNLPGRSITYEQPRETVRAVAQLGNATQVETPPERVEDVTARPRPIAQP